MKIDWYSHYIKKGCSVFGEETFRKNLIVDVPYINLLKKYLKLHANILECGCGLGRTAVSMSVSGYKITAIDNNRNVLKLARINAGFGIDIEFFVMDLFDINKIFKMGSFNCCTHQGVLEHYSRAEIKKLLKKQLCVENYVIFSVPLDTRFNRIYFNDKLYRNLWSENYWTRTILTGFYIIETVVVKQRTDNLLIVIRKEK